MALHGLLVALGNAGCHVEYFSCLIDRNQGGVSIQLLGMLVTVSNAGYHVRSMLQSLNRQKLGWSLYSTNNASMDSKQKFGSTGLKLNLIKCTGRLFILFL